METNISLYLHKYRSLAWNSLANFKSKFNRENKHASQHLIELSAWINALLATEWVKGVDNWFAKFNHTITNDYNKAIDAMTFKAGMGGSRLHHLLDGNHTVWGAIKAACDASPHDSNFLAVMKALEHLLRDMCSKSGISPFLHLTREQFDQLASYTHLPKLWLNDMLTFNAAEVVGATLSSLSLIYGWNRLESEKFAELAGRLSIIAIVQTNPLLVVITLTALARAYTMTTEPHKIKEKQKTLALHLLKGSVSPTILYFISFLIPGPASIGILTGIIVAAMIQRKVDDKNFWASAKELARHQYEDFLKPNCSEIAKGLLQACTTLRTKIQLKTTLIQWQRINRGPIASQ